MSFEKNKRFTGGMYEEVKPENVGENPEIRFVFDEEGAKVEILGVDVEDVFIAMEIMWHQLMLDHELSSSDIVLRIKEILFMDGFSDSLLEDARPDHKEILNKLYNEFMASFMKSKKWQVSMN